MIKKMEMVFYIILTTRFNMKGNEKMMKMKKGEYIILEIMTNIQGNLKKTFFMEKEVIFNVIKIFMKEIGKMIKKTAMANFVGYLAN